MGRGVTVAIDASALLALVFDEPGGERVAEVDAASRRVSAVSLAEAMSKLVERGWTDEEAETALDSFLPFVAPFDVEHALRTGSLRRETRHRGLSLGDRACLALASVEGGRAMTADRKWAEVDLPVEVEFIR